MKETDFMNLQIKSVETTRQASRLCLRLFPQWSKPPFQGEIQNIILLGWENNLVEKNIIPAVNWWIWIRNELIENTITRETKLVLWKTALSATTNIPINLITSRSPELLHAQIGKGDPSLPRSTASLIKFKQLFENSSQLIPTEPVIIFADRAIDNFDKISASCDIEDKITENISRISAIANSVGLKNVRIIRLSELHHPLGSIGSLIDLSGKIKNHPPISPSSWKLIEIAHHGSSKSQMREFEWSVDRAREHNLVLAKTMGLVGQAIKHSLINPILIHNEAFIERGVLNNLFLDPKNPLPVICLKDLLANKHPKL